MTRSAVAFYQPRDRYPSQRLLDISPTYRVAIEAYKIVCDLGVSGDVEAAIWSLCQREADAVHTMGLGGQ
jgi:hypothetical protein